MTMPAVERDPGRPTLGRRTAFRLAAVALGVLAALGLAEITLRVLGVRPPALHTKTHLTDGSLHFH
jgi:hypothetical protein